MRASMLEHARYSPSWIKALNASSAIARVLHTAQGVNLTELYRAYDTNKVGIWQGWIARIIGEILLNIDDQHMSQAEDWIQKAIEADTKNGMMWHLGRDYALYAELFKRKSDHSKAKENLNEAIEILKECGADGWVEEYEEELTALQ